MDYKRLEKELKKRIHLEYVWGRKQTDEFDKLTNFIYKTYSFKTLLKKNELHFGKDKRKNDLKNYTLNRWFNFWSAKGVESIFCEHKNVKKHKNSYNKYTDFYIENIPFDHKTTVFPKGFKSVTYAKKHPKELINWLYKNQSSQQRQHFKNRLFIVLVNTKNTTEHWKLKAEINWLQQLISTYLLNFDRTKLVALSFDNKLVLADIIWAVK